MNPLKNPAAAAKFWVAVGGVIVVLGTALGDGHMTGTEWGGVAAATVAAVAVFLTPNKPAS